MELKKGIAGDFAAIDGPKTPETSSFGSGLCKQTKGTCLTKLASRYSQTHLVVVAASLLESSADVRQIAKARFSERADPHSEVVQLGCLPMQFLFHRPRHPVDRHSGRLPQSSPVAIREKKIRFAAWNLSPNGPHPACSTIDTVGNDSGMWFALRSLNRNPFRSGKSQKTTP